MHYYIISGELSGDLYGSYLIHALRKHDKDALFTCWGGDYMKKAGGNVVVNLSDLSFMGFWEVFKNSRKILKNLFFAKKHIKDVRPDALILIDYPGFNMQIAKYAKKHNIPVFWFIAPQLWAWNGSRIKKMQKYVDVLFVALPFEQNYFNKRGVKTFYFGHPILDTLPHNLNSDKINKLGKPIIALLPGSRENEVQYMLPVMLEASSRFSDYRIIVLCAPNIARSFYEHLTHGFNVELKFDKDLLPYVHAAVVTSGTASLELTFYKIPQVVCYKLNMISFMLAKLFIRVKYISLVNIIANKLVVEELIQNNFNVDNLQLSIKNILLEKNRKNQITAYESVVKDLGVSGCFKKISQVIYSDLVGIKK